MTRIVQVLSLSCLCIGSACHLISQKQSTLSNLEATKDTPLYTTYAAAIERSNFILDEGYQFVFYDSSRGADFITDTGGDIGLAFRKAGRVAYKLSDMYREPVITTSYPDMVTYYYYPFEKIRVDATFLVQSSMAALLDLHISNETEEPVSVTIYPFMRNGYRSFDRIEQSEDRRAFLFLHQEYPDNWTVRHNLPYVTDIHDVFLLSKAPDRTGIFNSFNGESFTPPFEVFPDREAHYQVNGRAFTPEGERITKQPPDVRIQVYLNNHQDKLLTEHSPVWEIAQPGVDQNGFFRIELGNFGKIKDGSTYTFTYYDAELHAVERYTETIMDASVTPYRRDMALHDYDLPPVPDPVQIQVDREQRTVRLNWNNIGKGYSYRVYRREYDKPYYTLIAKQLQEASIVDRNVNLEKTYGYIVLSRDKSTEELSIHSEEVTTLPIAAFHSFLEGKPLAAELEHWAKVLSFERQKRLEPGGSEHIRLVRAVDSTANLRQLLKRAVNLLDEKLNPYLKANERLFSKVPELMFKDPDREMLWWSAFNMMRQVFYPPEGKSSYNYYVFSREPTWGWGHGGQVFHESLTIIAYAYLDPHSAMNSQRVYSERQYDNGYINYRTGPYLDEIIEYNGQLTSSAPWYNWINLELYNMTGDREFLEEMYESGKRFYEYYVSNRDSDNDGLCEWGAHAVLESVRDALVAVWDQAGWPSNFEAADLNSMLVMEAKSLEKMASELGLQEEARNWKKDYLQRSRLINETFWDSVNGFYYHVDKEDHDFTFKNPDDLKRDEIIGFLPLWAGIATEEQAARLVDRLTDPDQFWRKYGVPSLSAADPYYNDKGYWNGPVWVEWNFLIVRGLLNYGYVDEARELVNRVSKGMIIQLKKNHNLWEFYSPDDEWAGYHKTYIWTGIINRMMMEVENISPRDSFGRTAEQ